MTTATAIKIRRNADGQQNLNDLRKALSATDNSVYHHGGKWMASIWSDAHGCHLLKTCPYYWTERQAIQSALGLRPETRDEAKYYFGK